MIPTHLPFHSIICLSASMLSRNTFPDLLDIVGNTEIAIALAICLLFYISLIISGHIWLVSGIILSFLEQCFLTAPCFRILGALVWFLDVKVDGSQLYLCGFKFIWCAWTDYLMWEHAEWSFLPQQQITNTYCSMLLYFWDKLLSLPCPTSLFETSNHWTM